MDAGNTEYFIVSDGAVRFNLWEENSENAVSVEFKVKEFMRFFEDAKKAYEDCKRVFGE